MSKKYREWEHLEDTKKNLPITNVLSMICISKINLLKNQKWNRFVFLLVLDEPERLKNVAMKSSRPNARSWMRLFLSSLLPITHLTSPQTRSKTHFQIDSKFTLANKPNSRENAAVSHDKSDGIVENYGKFIKSKGQVVNYSLKFKLESSFDAIIQ